MAKVSIAARMLGHLVLEDGGRCHYCDDMTLPHVPQDHPARRTLEHIVPKWMGGTRVLYNIVIACYKCNSEHGDAYLKCFCGVCINARTIFELESLVACAQADSRREQIVPVSVPQAIVSGRPRAAQRLRRGTQADGLNVAPETSAMYVRRVPAHAGR